MTTTLRQQITNLTGINDRGGLDALAAIMYGESPACVIAQMDSDQFRNLVHLSVGIWADRDWPRAEVLT